MLAPYSAITSLTIVRGNLSMFFGLQIIGKQNPNQLIEFRFYIVLWLNHRTINNVER